MRQAVARELCALNSEFYRKHASSFSATRVLPWSGWQRVLDSFGPPASFAGVQELSSDRAKEAPLLALLDVACGNLRFERFLDGEYAGAFRALVLDSCDELVLDALREYNSGREIGRGSVTFCHVDVLQGLFDHGAGGLAPTCGCAAHDVAVCFGFMHHVPGAENRVALLRALVRSVCTGGIVAVSLWRFAGDKARRLKVRETDARAFAQMPELGWSFRAEDLEPGDHFLGWKNMSDTWRYCHSFSDEDIAQLACALSDEATVVDSFFADGKTDAMNAYLVLKRLN